MIREHKEFGNYIADPGLDLRSALERIEENKKGALIIVDEGILKGALSDGDIRRGLLGGTTMESTIEEIMNRKPRFLGKDFVESTAESMFIENKISLVPVVDEGMKVLLILSHEEENLYTHVENPVVLMVGGEGTRLAPMTHSTPKPLLKVGDKPILQIILERLEHAGFRNVYLCTGYRSEDIENFCGDGSRFNLSIKYFREEEKLGTVGAVKYLEEDLKMPFLLMNGDLLTLLNYRHVLNFHFENEGDLTVGSKEFIYSLPYGVLEMEGIEITNVVEKPHYTYRVNAGIYVINNELLEFIPKGKYFDITELIAKVLEKEKKLLAFPIEEYWIDIGQHQDYIQANEDYQNYFGENQ